METVAKLEVVAVARVGLRYGWVSEPSTSR
jgi:hypothetical protein